MNISRVMSNVIQIVTALVLAGGALIGLYAGHRLFQAYEYEANHRRRRRERTPEIECKECNICKEDLTTEGVELLPCGHIFHAFCIKEWFGVRYNCPSCRESLPNHLISEYRRRLGIN
ncbi:zinc finger-like protein [Dinothrombium tinctorium]|uniref:Zinc finger-like protein n=1 Tax=Dinothrombium tinctorium TaxID=1965070 RepID=A0A443RJC7_9ACAR|nr:zinc finger-like protein [Dinothrombium tinctorium]